MSTLNQKDWPEHRLQEEAQRRKVGHWIFLYAKRYCEVWLGLTWMSGKLKGRNHVSRREVNEHDPILCWLPHDYMLPRKRRGRYDPGHKSNHNATTGSTARRRVVREEDYEKLIEGMLAVGYDMVRSRVLCVETYNAAAAFFRLHGEPLPFQTARENLPAMKEKLAAWERSEDARLFRQLQS